MTGVQTCALPISKAQGVLVSQVSPRRIRLVTNLGVDRNGAERAADVLAGLV